VTIAETSSVGIDIGATKWLVCLDDSNDEPLKGQVHDDPAATLSEIELVLKARALRIQALCCSFAGAVDKDGSVNSWPNRPSWRGFQLSSHLTTCAGGSLATIEDDGTCATVGEATAARMRSFRNILCVTLGTGIGSGMLLEGRLRRPVQGQPRTLGHFRAGTDVECSCGSIGCLQAALFKPKGVSPTLIRPIDPRERGLRRLFEVTADLALMLDLEAIVVTGGLLGHAPELRAIIVDGIRQELRSYGCTVVASERPHYSAAVGAYQLAKGWEAQRAG
jgi:hypothetical protein